MRIPLFDMFVQARKCGLREKVRVSLNAIRTGASEPGGGLKQEAFMDFSAYWKPGLLLLAFAAARMAPSTAPVPVDTAEIAQTIKADVAQLVAGLNAHDVAKTTAYDAPNVISMECGRPSTVGIEADREGFKMGFAREPSWRVSLIDETVDVASSGDLAIYRGTYNEDNTHAGVPMTHKMNFIAEFQRQNDQSWKIVWYSVSLTWNNRIRSSRRDAISDFS
jgi:ketosteroid isomerase-like protein